jgi:hypothetical protein
MAVSKVRCTSCKNYFRRDELQRTNPNLCSQYCVTAHFQRKPKRKPVSSGEKHKTQEIPDKIRQEVLARDSNSCRYCGLHTSLNVHHIVYRSQGGPHENWNLITLCAEHHALVHSNKRYWMPILRGVIWATYVNRVSVRIPTFLRWFSSSFRESNDISRTTSS